MKFIQSELNKGWTVWTDDVHPSKCFQVLIPWI